MGARRLPLGRNLHFSLLSLPLFPFLPPCFAHLEVAAQGHQEQGRSIPVGPLQHGADPRVRPLAHVGGRHRGRRASGYGRLPVEARGALVVRVQHVRQNGRVRGGERGAALPHELEAAVGLELRLDGVWDAVGDPGVVAAEGHEGRGPGRRAEGVRLPPHARQLRLLEPERPQQLVAHARLCDLRVVAGDGLVVHGPAAVHQLDLPLLYQALEHTEPRRLVLPPAPQIRRLGPREAKLWPRCQVVGDGIEHVAHLGEIVAFDRLLVPRVAVRVWHDKHLHLACLCLGRRYGKAHAKLLRARWGWG